MGAFDSGVFYKMQGSGNDFILFDNRELSLTTERMSNWAITLCPRAFAVGADGMIFLSPIQASGVDYKWDFYNSDGSRAEMCGNGSRCAARLAFELGMAGRDQVFRSDAGDVEAHILEDGAVRVQLPSLLDLETNIDLQMADFDSSRIHFANTGVPHAVITCDDLQSIDVPAIGEYIRNHGRFAPDGANVNFIQVIDKDNLLLRTYERGVEDETYACGTGAAASVAVARKLGFCSSQVRVRTSGGEVLGVRCEAEKIFLSGGATLVYKGELNRTEMGL